MKTTVKSKIHHLRSVSSRVLVDDGLGVKGSDTFSDLILLFVNASTALGLQLSKTKLREQAPIFSLSNDAEEDGK